MKKLFTRRKKDGEAGEQQGAAPPPAAPAAADVVPPLPLQQLASGGPYGLASPGGSGYLGPPARTLSGGATGRSLGRSQSGLSSGRRSARRPREFIDLSQPEQVDAGSDGEGGGSAGLGQAGEQQREQQERDLALAWQLALGAQADQQPPAPLLAPAAQQQQQAAGPSPLAAQPSFTLDARQQAALAEQFQSLPVSQLAGQPFPLHGSLPLPRRPLRRGASRREAAQADVALAAALADAQFAAQQQEVAAALAAQTEAEYQVMALGRPAQPCRPAQLPGCPAPASRPPGAPTARRQGGGSSSSPAGGGQGRPSLPPAAGRGEGLRAVPPALHTSRNPQPAHPLPSCATSLPCPAGGDRCSD